MCLERAWTELNVPENWDHFCTVVSNVVPLGCINLMNSLLPGEL